MFCACVSSISYREKISQVRRVYKFPINIESHKGGRERGDISSNGLSTCAYDGWRSLIIDRCQINRAQWANLCYLIRVSRLDCIQYGNVRCNTLQKKNVIAHFSYDIRCNVLLFTLLVYKCKDDAFRANLVRHWWIFVYGGEEEGEKGLAISSICQIRTESRWMIARARLSECEHNFFLRDKYSQYFPGSY